MRSAISLLILFVLISCQLVVSQSPTLSPLPAPTLGIDGGSIDLQTPVFRLRLIKDSQTLASLEPRTLAGFDFTPRDRLASRDRDGFYHLGDINFRLQRSDGNWDTFSTAAARKPVLSLPVGVPDLAKADLSSTLPECPVRVIRTWTIRGGRLTLHFELKNKTDKPIEIGHLGIPLVFNNIITGRKLPEAHENNSFTDPYIGLDAGYVQVTRLKGTGPALVVVPFGKTPFEAYQPLREPARPQQTAEGIFEWTVRSKALAEQDWGNAIPWNTPTSEVLPPNGRREIGLQFLLSDRVQTIEQTLKANGRPVAVGIPGYVLPNDVEGRLFLQARSRVTKIESIPASAMTVKRMSAPSPKWQAFAIESKGWGRARLLITYADGSKQSINYYLTKPSSETVSDLGKFLFNKQWYENPSDPFGRSPSIMGFDRDTNKIVEQDQRVWIAGLGDEGGGGSWVAGAMKQFVAPNGEEIAKFDRFIEGVLWGGLQYKDGPNKYGVRKSMLYYAPDEFPNFQYDKTRNWTTWASWKKEQAMSVGRGYNYPHVVAAYWSMYRNARNYDGITKQSWNWYLDQAFETTKFAFSKKRDGKYVVDYVELGLMEGTIFLELLKDLKREGWTEKGGEIERLMKERADAWAQEEYPFGSEMAWDSTGQEEVYNWSKYFGHDDKAAVSLNSIVGYMPLIPHWGYNGNARRYWDFLYAAKLSRIERQIHHYGSGLNAIPMLDHFRSNPNDLYYLRVGYAGGNAALTNIDREGFASAAFHSFPDTLKWDAYSGDYGMNFFGFAMNVGTYVINDRELGWQAFGGNVEKRGDTITVKPEDSMRRRIYIAPFGLWLTLDTGTFSGVTISLRTRTVTIGFDEGPQSSKARLRIEQPAKRPGVGEFGPTQILVRERDAYVIPTDQSENSVTLTARR